MLEFLLIASLGFLGSFGHCASMCGPIAAAFTLSQSAAPPAPPPDDPSSHPKLSQSPSAFWHHCRFHVLLNGGRIASYALVGGGIGLVGSVLLAGGQLAGVGSDLRQLMTWLTGGLLVWMGLVQINPELPKVPLLNPFAQHRLHDRFSRAMVQLSSQTHWWTPALLGLVWGLVPCGFLYTAQIKAAATGNWQLGAATMLAFGLGTMPMMVMVGLSTALISHDRRSQLFRLGGWITLTIGLLTLARTGDTMVDYTGHGALIGLILALIARPISRLWSLPLRGRRVLGVGAFVLALAHTAHMLEHTWGWQVQAWLFMLPQHQWGIGLGLAGLLLLTPPALTSFDWVQHKLGPYWRSLHLLTVPALLCCAVHCTLTGSTYLGRLQLDWRNWSYTLLLTITVLGTLLLRSRWFWKALSLGQFYVPSQSQSAARSALDSTPADSRQKSS